jgi:hypothetical protein
MSINENLIFLINRPVQISPIGLKHKQLSLRLLVFEKNEFEIRIDHEYFDSFSKFVYNCFE